MALTVLATKSRFWRPLRALAVSMRTGIISGLGRISVAPGPPGREPSGYGMPICFQAPDCLRIRPVTLSLPEGRGLARTVPLVPHSFPRSPWECRLDALRPHFLRIFFRPDDAE